MNKAQALALMNALEANKVGATAAMRFDPAGAESWAVNLDPSVTYTGAQLATLTNYCTAQGLSLTVIVDQMGVI